MGFLKLIIICLLNVDSMERIFLTLGLKKKKKQVKAQRQWELTKVGGKGSISDAGRWGRGSGEGARALTLGREGARMTFTFASSSAHLDVPMRSLICLSYSRGRAMPHLTKTSRESHCISKSIQNHLSKKKQLELGSPITTEMNLYAEGILGAIYPQANVPFIASGMGGYFNLCLGICHYRKFHCSSLFLFRTTLIRKFFLMLEQTSVIYKVPLFPFLPSEVTQGKSNSSPFLWLNRNFKAAILFYSLLFPCSLCHQTLHNPGHLPLDTIYYCLS